MKKQRQKGFTLPELLVALGILTILFSIVTITLLRSQRGAAQGTLVDTLLTDLRDQQTKAMSQDTGGSSANNDYGVYLAGSSYTLFRGSVYNSGDSNNFTVGLAGGLVFSQTTLPGSSIVFESGSGEVVGFSPVANTFSVEDTTNGQVTQITLNKYGVPLE